MRSGATSAMAKILTYYSIAIANNARDNKNGKKQLMGNLTFKHYLYLISIEKWNRSLQGQAVMFGKKYANFMFRFPLFSIAVIHHVKTDKLSLAQHNFKCSRSGKLMEL